MRAVVGRPLTGWGADGFGVGKAATSTLERLAAIVGPGTPDPHNLIVWIAVSAGVVGLALFGWFATEMVLAWRSRAHAGIDITAPVWAIGMCLMVALTAPLTLHVWPMLALTLGVSLWRPRASDGPSQPQSPAGDQRAMRAVTVAAFVLIALASGAMALNAATRATVEVTRPPSTSEQAARSVAAGRDVADGPLHRAPDVDPHRMGLVDRPPVQRREDRPCRHRESAVARRAEPRVRA